MRLGQQQGAGQKNRGGQRQQHADGARGVAQVGEPGAADLSELLLDEETRRRVPRGRGTGGFHGGTGGHELGAGVGGECHRRVQAHHLG